MVETIQFDAFQNAKPGEIFAFGNTFDRSSKVNFRNDGTPVLWVAVKGGSDDWAIYFDSSIRDEGWIRAHGRKLFIEDVRNIVLVSDYVLARYRK